MIRYEFAGGVATLTMERAPLNVLNIELLAILNRQLDEIAADPKVTVLLLRSSLEKGFSAGVDVADHVPEKVHQMLTSFHRAIRLIDRWNKISIAQVHGVCLGGAAELAFGCDLVIAEENAVFGFPEIDLGCFAPVAAAHLPNRVGWQIAAEYLFTGRRFGAKEAYNRGLVNAIAPAKELAKTASDYATAIASKSPAVLRISRRVMRESRETPFSQALWMSEEAYREQLLATEDCKEGLRSFQEKRPPKWTGK